MEQRKLFNTYHLGKIELKNRIVMAPMTRSRAIGNIPNELNATYYGQRAGAGLIITEGTSPSPNGLGYSRIPGLFGKEQVEGWKKVTSAVHAKDGKIFVQIMHTGRISHPLNLPKGALVLAPSAVKPAGQMWTDSDGMQDFPIPKGMSSAELFQAKEEYVTASKNAIEAGFDGVELHGANGYLLEQFISPVSNKRTDNYGGSIENRCRFVIEVVSAVCKAIGKDKVGIRFSPYGVASDMPHYPEIDETYTYLANKINEIGLVYVHLVDHSAMGAPQVPATIKKTFRDIFKGSLILSGGYDLGRAEQDIENKSADLIAFGRPFINNPDLVYRFQNNKQLTTELDMAKFYTPDEKGYTDYAFLE
ncbi:MAG: alkene reductase [Bacteroidales bacterium]|nr:MAG: alkene reductase [Bacteroidales bacterium]